MGHIGLQLTEHYPLRSCDEPKPFFLSDFRGRIMGKVSDIQPGLYECPFSFSLERTCPSSLICMAGVVQYRIVAKCLYKLYDHSQTKKIQAVHFVSVNKYLDLQANPFAQVGAVVRHHSFDGWWCLFFCRGELTVTMESKRRAFVGGDHVDISATISNLTSFVFPVSMIDIVQIVKTKHRKTKQVIVKKGRGVIGKYTTQFWLNETLLVPALPPSSDDFNMKISYQLRMKLIREDSKDIKLKMPIVIGNIPLNYSIVTEVRRELSFISSVDAAADAWRTFIPSYLVYRFSDDRQGVPTAPDVTT